MVPLDAGVFPEDLAEFAVEFVGQDVVAENSDQGLVTHLGEELVRGFDLERSPFVFEEAFGKEDDQRSTGFELTDEFVGDGVQSRIVFRAVFVEKAQAVILCFQGSEK